MNPIYKTSTKKRKYKKPDLIILGDLRSLTLGGSPGQNDSGYNTKPNRPIPAGFPDPGGFNQPGQPPQPWP